MSVADRTEDTLIHFNLNLNLRPTSIDRKEGVRQCPSNAIERISVPMLSSGELDINVNGSTRTMFETQISYISPNLEDQILQNSTILNNSAVPTCNALAISLSTSRVDIDPEIRGYWDTL